MNRARTGLCLVAAMLIGAVAAADGQTQNASAPLATWHQTLAELETQVKSLRADDRQAVEEVAARVRALDVEVTEWLQQRGRRVDPAPQGQDLASVVADVSRVRALLAQVRAASDAPGADSGVFYLGRVDVAVTARAERESPAVTSLDAEQLRALDAKTVTQALSATAGVTMQRMGARNEGMVYIRGFDLRQVPVFIDGVPVYVPYDGYVDLDRFATDDLSEVRVTKG